MGHFTIYIRASFWITILRRYREFPQSGPYGGFIALCLLIALGRLKRKGLWFSVLSVFLLFIALLLSDSRAAWVALTGGGIYLFFPFLRYRFGFLSRVFLYIGGIAGFFLLLVVLYFYKKDSAEGRLLVWQVAGRMIAEKPVVGHGVSAFDALYMHYQADLLEEAQDERYELLADDVRHAFNEYILLAVELGSIGILLVALLLHCLYFAHAPPEGAPRVMWAGMLVVLLFSCFSYPFDFIVFRVLAVLFLGTMVNRSGYPVLFSYRLPSVVLVSVFVCSFILLILGGREFVFYHKARQAMEVLPELVDRKHELKEFYARLYRDPDFVLPYGKWLYNRRHYSEAIPVLEQAVRLVPLTEIYLDLGQCYAREQASCQAERCFLTAARMIPGRLLPHYYLLLLYDSGDGIEKAREKAREIVVSDVKVVNSVTLEIKARARQYLNRTLYSEGGDLRNTNYLEI